ncbi:HalOD1 output domain-containing protein [Halovivax sp.]|uniref:HalOD1 output domain-containing protein n=1 Tax=Halovivax sp. TaxID=1935978 RepID=UPI0025C031A7|nr:HalOD1 output domain-containing protein [Halovivax sp.]
MSSSDRDDGPTLTTRELDTDAADPNVEVVRAVSELEGVPPGELPALYRCMDHVLENLFSDPPAPEANVEISFSYHGYRIAVAQNGTARFEKRG